jgi:transcriptional regulator with XRE-family HTH domain
VASDRRRELKEFLMARRAAVSPASAGLPPGTRRRTPGLRREELATLASVGITWYTWLEQGRDIRVSADTLHRIARALRLTPTDTEYLFALAGVPRADRDADEGAAQLHAGVQPLLDAIAAPAFVVNAYWDVEAYNDFADRIYHFNRGHGRFARNHMWRFFMDPERQALYVDWEPMVGTAVGILRVAYARRVGDRYFDDLIAALVDGSPIFSREWRSQQTAPLTAGRVRLRVRGYGELRVTSMRLRFSESEDCLLVVLPPFDRSSARLLARMAALRGSRRAVTGRRRT